MSKYNIEAKEGIIEGIERIANYCRYHEDIGALRAAIEILNEEIEEESAVNQTDGV